MVNTAIEFEGALSKDRTMHTPIGFERASSGNLVLSKHVLTHNRGIAGIIIEAVKQLRKVVWFVVKNPQPGCSSQTMPGFIKVKIVGNGRELWI